MGDAADSALSYFMRSFGRKAKGKKPPIIVWCKYCGKKDLRWGQAKGGKWEVRTKNGERHICVDRNTTS